MELTLSEMERAVKGRGEHGHGGTIGPQLWSVGSQTQIDGWEDGQLDRLGYILRGWLDKKSRVKGIRLNQRYKF